MSQQVVDMFSLDCECSICLENIIGESNKVVTDCGHTFHCKCLMKNITFNGFGCPYCRNAMAEYDGNYDDDDDDDDDDEDEEDEDEDEDEEEEEESMPNSTLVTSKLKEKGFTMEDLVKIHLFLEHGNWGRYYREYEGESGILFREVSEIIEQHKGAPNSAETIPDDPFITNEENIIEETVIEENIIEENIIEENIIEQSVINETKVDV
jgi:hypothetical protein